ncbi:enoyl-CoA hydratase/isomerase family protein [Aquincola sp. MAHUQ-54]|uniref:Enoyl-CoA hydratase/isomerase family protein n=1 Tax=Aquincola agrisoli TaxID=3119538 RepID=A0AAW9QIB0_9BURK
MAPPSWSALVVRDDPATAIRRVVIDNPPLGVLNQDVRRELGDVFLATQSDRAIRCLVFGSGPRSFCAGADLREFALRFDPLVARAHVENAHRMILALVELDVPTIASIHGACMGGGLELALGCTYRIAARSAKLALPEVNRGAWPGTGGCLLLSRQVRPALSKRLLYTGETLDASTACALGVIDEVVEDDALEARTQALALQWASQPGSSIRTLTTLVDRDFRARFRSHLQYEAECFVQAYQTPAAREGYQAFFEKRPPQWQQA